MTIATLPRSDSTRILDLHFFRDGDPKPLTDAERTLKRRNALGLRERFIFTDIGGDVAA